MMHLCYNYRRFELRLLYVASCNVTCDKFLPLWCSSVSHCFLVLCQHAWAPICVEKMSFLYHLSSNEVIFANNQCVGWQCLLLWPNFPKNPSAETEVLLLLDRTALLLQLSALLCVNTALTAPALNIWVRHLLAVSSLGRDQSGLFCKWANTILAIQPSPFVQRLEALLKISPGCSKVGSFLWLAKAYFWQT